MPLIEKLNEKWFRKRRLWRHRAGRVAEIMPEFGRLLDVGCSHAKQSETFAKKATNVFGIDIIKHERWDKTKGMCIVGDAMQLPFKRAAFDVVVCGEILEHLKDDEACLKEAGWVLKGSGCLIVTVPNRERFNRRVLNFLHLKRKIHAEHLREYTMREITNLLERNGFAIEHKSGIGFLWFDLPARAFPTLALGLVVKARRGGE